MTDTARDHLERAVAWLTDLEDDRERPGTRMGAARAEVKHALELLDAIPPRDPTSAMIDAAVGIDLIKTGWRGGVAILWKQMYDAALAEKEGK